MKLQDSALKILSINPFQLVNEHYIGERFSGMQRDWISKIYRDPENLVYAITFVYLDVVRHLTDMEQVINIHNNGHQIDLEIGKYKIDVLGGWGVKLGQFSISLKHNLTGQTVDCERAFWPVQSFAFGKRAKRIFVVRIVESGTYKVEFRQPTTLEVKETPYNKNVYASLG